MYHSAIAVVCHTLLGTDGTLCMVVSDGAPVGKSGNGVYERVPHRFFVARDRPFRKCGLGRIECVQQ